MALRKNYVFLVAGQSNAVGTGSDMDLTTSPLNDDYISFGGGEILSVRFAEQSSCGNDYPAACAVEKGWQRLECQAPVGSKVFGPAISLGFDLDAQIGIGTTEDANVWIIVCATGSRDLYDDWDAAGSTSDYELYARMIAYYNARVAEIEANPGTPGEVIYGGMLWAQGESDAGVEAESLNYEDNLNAFIAQLNTDLGVAPFVISKLNTTMTPTWVGNVRTAQDAVAAADANVYANDTEALTIKGSNHYDEDSYVTIGSDAAVDFIAHWGW